MEAHAAFPLKRWSTDEVSPNQGLDYWIDAISEGFLSMGAHSSRRRFQGTLTSARLGAIGVNLVDADPQRVWRGRREIARDTDRNCYLIGDLHSAWQVRQDGRSATVNPGDFVLVDSRRPYDFLFDASVHCVSLELPLHWVSYWIATPEAHVVQPFRRDRNGSWADALASLACALRPEIGTSPAIAPDLIVDQLGAMLALACEPASLPTDHDNTLIERVVAVLRQRFSEPGLTAADVALSVGISVRTLHRKLGACQRTFAQMLQDERMAVARRMLSSPRLAGVSSAEIGRRVGLLDPSHFTRLCKRVHGVTPTQLRPR